MINFLDLFASILLIIGSKDQNHIFSQVGETLKWKNVLFIPPVLSFYHYFNMVRINLYHFKVVEVYHCFYQNAELTEDDLFHI